MKPWERALKRDPMCVFIETVVDGYSPIDKHMCKFGRVGALMRSLPWWTEVPVCTPHEHRGHVTYRRQHPDGDVWSNTDNAKGEMPWR